MTQTKRLRSAIWAVALVLLLSAGGDWLGPRPTADGDVPEVFSLGSGATQVLIARTRAVDSESELLRLLKEGGIRLTLFDVQHAFAKW
jgi:hypothetical protein